MKIGPSKKWGLKTSIFGAKIPTLPFSDCRFAETRNSRKTKTTGITTIVRLYPYIHVLVKFGSGSFEL